MQNPYSNYNTTRPNIKKRRVPLHLLDKQENELQKLIEDKHIVKLDEHFISPVVKIVKKDKSVKKSTRLQKAKRCYAQKQISDAKHRPFD